MITIVTERHNFQYFGKIDIMIHDLTVYITSHCLSDPRRNNDELDVWRMDVFDMFFKEDVITILGE